MTVTGDRIKELRKEKGLSQEELGAVVGITKQSISAIETGKKFPGRGVLTAMGDYFNVDIDYLLGNRNTRNSYEFEGVFKAGYDEALKNLKKLKNVPIYSGLSCGRGVGVDELPTDFIDVPAYMTGTGDYFANPADGDSMNPGIKHGDLLIFEESPVIESGQVGAFSLNDQYYCKRFKRFADGSCWLISDNTEYQPIRIKTTDTFRVLGVYRLKLSKEQ